MIFLQNSAASQICSMCFFCVIIKKQDRKVQATAAGNCHQKSGWFSWLLLSFLCKGSKESEWSGGDIHRLPTFCT